MNNINLTQEELSYLSKIGTIEIYTEKQFNSFIEMNEDLAKGAEIEELDEIQKGDYEEFVAEIQSFSKAEVFGFKEGSNYLVEKSICYIRPKQVEWTEEEVIEKSEAGEETITKAKSGIYTDTGLNRKLGRVGAKYGSKKEGLNPDRTERSTKTADYYAKIEGKKKKTPTKTSLKSHPQYSKEDHRYLKGKGWSDEEILERWNEEHFHGKSPVTWGKNDNSPEGEILRKKQQSGEEKEGVQS